MVKSRLAVRVDTLEAIFNENYFIERIEDAIENANVNNLLKR